jgi:P27 family predicted phage terminase small subunit
MPRGRKPKSVFVRVLEGNRGHRPIPAVPQLDISPEVPEPPDYLGGYARDEWLRLAPGLHRTGCLTVLDLSIFAVYCTTVGRWMQCEHLLAEMAASDPKTEGLTVSTGAGSLTQHPIYRIAVQSARDMLRYAGELGLTPTARTRVAGGIAAALAPSKFDGLLGR